jgi:hypothetical protein
MPRNDGTPTIYECAKARDLAATNDATLTMHDAAIMRGQAATRAREANERQQAARRVAAQERARAHAILSHPAVVSGRARQLAHFLLFETDMSVAEAYAALDQAHAGDPEKVHPSGGYEAGRASAEHLVHPIEADRREKQALNDQAFAEANFGRVSIDRRTPRERQQADEFANIARRAKQDENEDDSSNLKAMGFGGGAQLEQSAYAQGAASASRLLGKGSPRAGNTGYASEALRPATSAPSADASYSAGAESARRLLGDTSAIRAEADNELRQRYADQQRERAQQN